MTITTTEPTIHTGDVEARSLPPSQLRPSPTRESDDDCTIWSPPGDLDAYTVGQFRNMFARIASAPRLILDLANVAFMDSAGLRALVAAVRHVRELGGKVAIACPRPALARVLLTTGMDRIVTVADSVDKARFSLI